MRMRVVLCKENEIVPSHSPSTLTNFSGQGPHSKVALLAASSAGVKSVQLVPDLLQGADAQPSKSVEQSSPKHI